VRRAGFDGVDRRGLRGATAAAGLEDLEREPVEAGAGAGEVELVGGVAEEGVAEEIGEFGMHLRILQVAARANGQRPEARG
jgi:hypothetical protein